ncbi:transglycosylase SLT domain-containing protein [Rahnella sp. SAP-1]|uniref:Transglycosylase SLT domain-containing protein n=1 Tax=Rouxiella aceris TaxID=2703884 RepID=A0A848MKW4_9GAMM|nr:transglycosylase SLT domain-containing protein [Rouxiella aceris]NMP26844.1 transglycosylase SLT domain-containing protein [Rouxiella aceris]
MNAETIKEFLVSLGFAVDDAGAKKFDAVIAGVTANVFKMAATVEGAAGAVMLFTTQVAAGLDNLYWASQRTGASVAGIKALGYAASQTGSSAEAAKGSLENLSRFMRNNPGAESFLNRLGVQTRDASGNMRDMSSVFTGIGQQLSKMPYYRANQYAQMLGIDENTLMAMRRGLAGFNADYSAMSKAIGYNADQAAVGSNKFMTSLRGFSAMAGMARDKIGSNLANGLAGSIDNLRKQILDNFPKIEETITRGVKGLLWLADIFGKVAYRAVQAVGDIIKWWNSLDNESKKLIGTFGLIIVAWRMLNSAFLMSPIGLITGLIIGLGLLYDDYQTWKEGGKSLIDWSKWGPEIERAKKAFGDIKKWLLELKDAVGGWQNVLEGLAIFVGAKWLMAMMGPIKTITSALMSFPALFTKALTLSGIYAIIASINEAYERMIALRDGTNPGGIATQSQEMGERDSLARRNWALNNPGVPFPGVQTLPEVARPHPTANGAAMLAWLSPTLNKLENLYHLPDGLLKSVAIAESGGDQNARSNAGAEGPFQLMPGTSKDLGLKNGEAFDPVKSANAAAKYLAQLLKANGGDLQKTIASYNWGVGNVQKYGMGLMPQETRNYVPRVLSNMPGGGKGASIQQETTININGVSDPMRAGKEVVDRQTGVNSRLTQQVAAGAR